MRVSIEVCVGSVAEGDVAWSFGVESVEACSWLAVGGVTPSLGLVRQLAVPGGPSIRVLVRPGPGAFTVDDGALRTMKEDVGVLSKDGSASGVVLGVLNAEGLPDVERSYAIMACAGSLEVTFHRAIDRNTDIRRAFGSICDLGIHRVLTSGGSSLAKDGMATIAWMVQNAPKGMIICAAGGITPTNVVEVVERTGVSEVHFAAQRVVHDPVPVVKLSSTGASNEFSLLPDPAKIEGVLQALSKAGLR